MGEDVEWESFEKKWQSAIDDYIGGQELHMKNFGRGQLYSGWDQDRLDTFMLHLVAAITDSGVHAIGCGVYLTDYERLIPEHKAFTKDPYYMAFQEVTKGLSMRGSPIHSPTFDSIEPVAMVYAYQKEYGATEAGRAQQLWHITKDSPERFPWASWMGTYISAKPSERLPLQAADLFAYELTREFEAWRKPNPPPMRTGLKALLKGLEWPPLIKLYTLPVILDMLWNSGAFEKPIQEHGPYAGVAYQHMASVDEALKERARI
ncbi:MAG: hypothetical protein P4L10_09645 [Acidobacteriaceae bacterium]|nr:hypothetical protein [Acidobacteriaceae bacterium]